MDKMLKEGIKVNSIDIKKYREIYNNIIGRSEETVKIQIVWQLLIDLGFDVSWAELETQIKSRRNIVDICYHLPQSKEKFYVEVKAPDVDLKDKELEQLSNYQNITNMTWGLLTNGRELILLNHKIDGHVNEKQILYVNLFENLDIDKFKYLTYDSIYKTKITNYFCYLSQFKIYFNQLKSESEKDTMSWPQYNSTIKAFFEFLISEFNYLELESIRIQDFKKFIKSSQLNRGELYSKSAIRNKYQHISSLLSALYRNKIITQNPYRDVNEDEALLELEYTEKNEFVPLSDEEISEIYRSMIRSRDMERNLLLLDFIFSIPIRSHELENLKVSDIDVDNMIVQVSDREIPITKKLLDRLQKYLEERLTRGVECEYIFGRKYSKDMGKMNKSSISSIFKKAVNKCNFPSKRKKEIDLRYVRGNVIYKYVHEGKFSLEEVMKIADCKFSTLDTYMNIEEIKLKTSIPIKKIEKLSDEHLKKYNYSLL